MCAATKDQGFLKKKKKGRGYFGAALKLKVAFADPGRSSCFKHARQAFREMQKPTAMGATLMKRAHFGTAL